MTLLNLNNNEFNNSKKHSLLKYSLKFAKLKHNVSCNVPISKNVF